MKFIFQYPIWFIAFCLLLGFIYSIVLYFKSNDFIEKTRNFKLIKTILAVFRFLSISILSFLLLSPLIKTRFIDKVQAKIIIVHDNSSSINLSFKNIDSTQYINSLNTLYKSIEEKYEIDFYSFSDKLQKKDTLDFKDKKTNISNILTELSGIYYNQNIGAVVLATDGIYNEGQNPYYTDFSFPIYPIALGDTSRQKDLKISNVKANKIAYLNDKLNIEIEIEAYNLKKENYKLSLFKNSKGKKELVKSKDFSISTDYIEKKAVLALNLNSIGTQHYTVSVSNLKNEVTHKNNSFDFYVEVIDSRQQILLLANAPHPDIAALKQTISLNKNLDLKVEFIKNYSSNISKYDLVILHQLPSKNNSIINIFSELKKEKNSYLIITGENTDFNLLNQTQSFLNIAVKAENKNEVSVLHNVNFNIFELSENTISKLRNFPPLSVPFADFKSSSASKSLLFQQISDIETNFPILTFNENFGSKSAVFIGDGLWRWRMHDHIDNNNQDVFNEIFLKTINYLALKIDKRKFRVNTSKKMYYEGEAVAITAELYNENYELINKPEIKIELKNEKGETFPLSFNRTNNSYQIKTNNLPIGNYSYTATTNYAGKIQTVKGIFAIKALQIEALETKANHKMLNQIASKTNGKLYYPNEIQYLQTLLLNKEDIKPILYESFKTSSIINSKWIFFLILTLLSAEWFVRKYNGGY